MKTKCCFCWDYRQASLLICLLRLLLWLILLSTSFVAVAQILSPNNQGAFNDRSRINLERNSIVVFTIALISVAGVVIEPMTMIHGINSRSLVYIRMWFASTIFCLVASSILAVSFLLQNVSVIEPGDSWFSDALLVFADMIYLVTPDTLLGPRLVSTLIALMILGHLALPLFHASSLYIVYSYYHSWHHRYSSSAAATAAAAVDQHAGTAPHSDTLTRDPYKPRLCQKCQLAACKDPNDPYPCSSQAKTYEITC